MGIFKDASSRLVRDNWSSVQELAEELYAMFNSDGPIQVDSPLVLLPSAGGGPSLSIRRPAGDLSSPIEITRGDGDNPETIGLGGSGQTFGGLTFDTGGIGGVTFDSNGGTGTTGLGEGGPGVVTVSRGPVALAGDGLTLNGDRFVGVEGTRGEAGPPGPQGEPGTGGGGGDGGEYGYVLTATTDDATAGTLYFDPDNSADVYLHGITSGGIDTNACLSLVANSTILGGTGLWVMLCVRTGDADMVAAACSVDSLTTHGIHLVLEFTQGTLDTTANGTPVFVRVLPIPSLLL
jgi:hypothetical protein